MKICTASEMRRLDEKAIRECGLPGVVLMENAGRGAAVLTATYFGNLSDKKIAIVCGKGNNGGDGFVMGRIFHGWGARVCFYLLGNREEVSGDARINLDVALKMGLEVIEIRKDAHLDRLNFSGADLIVDAIFGTGLNSEVRGRYREAIEAINRSPARVVAVDVPSGIHSDDGRVLGTAVRADLTATFGLPKIGLFMAPGERFAGKLEVVDIGLPPHVLAEAAPGMELILEETLAGLIAPRRSDDHKGRFGHVLILAGSTGKTGAAAMTALAAARTGAGLVTLAVPESLNPILEAKVTEAMTEPLPEESPGFLAADAIEPLLELTRGKSVLALGPGLGTRPGTIELVRNLVEKCKIPMVIDADGLNALAGEGPEILKRSRADLLLTPHPGEMARLSGLTTDQIAANRVSAATDFSKKFGVAVALKGYRTIVAAPDGRQFMNTTGGPHMASGGMGDILTGIAAGLVSQGLNVVDAARLGVFVHGLAADMTSEEAGPMGILASDLLQRLPGIWKKIIRE